MSKRGELSRRGFMMRELPILFTGEMVRAILEGRKTMTRRLVPVERYGIRNVAGCLDDPNDPSNWGVETDHGWCLLESDGASDSYALPCLYGDPGDWLYVRETWRLGGGNPGAECRGDVHYRADPDECAGGPWRPSIHMPRWAARIWLEVTGVRVERVQDITQDDARAEGAIDMGGVWGALSDKGRAGPRGAFEALWNSINAKRGYGWDVNPWVWVVEFRVLSANGKPNKEGD